MDRIKLKSRIYEMGTSQAKLAKQLGIKDRTLSNKVTGKTEFSLSEVVSLCKLLQIDDPRPIFFEN